MLNHKTVWAALDQLAKDAGYSSSGLAKKAGLDPTAFNKSKRFGTDDRPRWPSIESLSKALDATGKSLADFAELLGTDEDIGAAFSEARRKDIARHTAEILLDTQSVLFMQDEPFTFTSGKKSPVYTDCRKLIGFAKERKILMNYAAELLTAEIGRDKIDYVAGGETAGIPYAAFLSGKMDIPMVYVRKKPKGFGRMAQIEGHLPVEDNPHVVLVEDLQTDGGSKKVFIDALRDAGANVEHAFVVFHYGIFEASKQNMDAMGITLHTLATWWDVLDVAKERGYFTPSIQEQVESFLNDPLGWQEQAA